MSVKIFTNCFLVKQINGAPSHVCLAMKKRGFGVGMWNGSGGKPRDGESVEDAARREVEEELGVEVKEFRKQAEIDFLLLQEDKTVHMHAFVVTAWEGEPVETEEMSPRWFKVNEVPYHQMWASDTEWLPLVFAGKNIKARYTYAHEGGEVESRDVTEVSSF